MTGLPANPAPFGDGLHILRCVRCPEFLASQSKADHGYCPYDACNQRHKDEACSHLGKVACDEL